MTSTSGGAAGADQTVAHRPRTFRRSLTLAFQTLNHNWLTRVGAVLGFAYILFALVGPVLTPDPLQQSNDILQGPNGTYFFGTDQLGRDMLSRAAAGARVSLLVAIASVIVGLLLAVPAGMLAGFRGGTLLDEIIMRSVDVLLALPLFVLGMFVLGVFGTGDTQIGFLTIPAAWKVVVLIAIAATPFFARVARAATLTEVEEDYVDALRVVGVPRRVILSKEILVNVLPPVLVQAFLWIAIAIFAEAALSFLGLGIQAPQPTLGNILFDATSYMFAGAWWFSVLPGLVLLMATVAFNLVGDGLNDLLDPRLRQ
ncbi:MAG: ABC transporter permease [bacterium]|nr:ABC transporter permease [bacterium]